SKPVGGPRRARRWPPTSSSATAARGGAPNEFRADVRRRAGREPRRCPRRRRAGRRRDRRARPLHGRALGWLHARALYKLLAGAPDRPRGAWERIEFFWGDERPVPPDHPESNYGMTAAGVLDPLCVPRAGPLRAGVRVRGRW